MSMTTALAGAGILRGEEVAMLSDVFEEITTSSEYLGDKPAREELAKKILLQYQSGVVDPQELKRMCTKP